MTAGTARRPIRETAFWQAYNRRRYAVLFYSLLVSLIAVPAASTVGLPQTLVKLLVATSLLAAVMPNVPRRQRNLLLAIILLVIGLRFVAEPDEVPINFGPVLALYGLTGLIAAAATLKFVVRSPTVDGETVYAALSTYLLAGLFFGVVYSAIEFMRPGSFLGPDPFTEATAVYYSFVTLATLGYGDFLPKSELARGVATFEVIGGQLFLAVMVARLVGLFAEGKRSE